jgi:hypothetical protein
MTEPNHVPETAADTTAPATPASVIAQEVATAEHELAPSEPAPAASEA